MSRVEALEPEFVEEIPRQLTPGKLFISVTYRTATHLCCCGCGNEVVTPIHPTRWALTYDGETVSLNPSVGSWSLPCQSHYVVRKNRVRWAARWSQEKIDAGRERERRDAEAHFSAPPVSPASQEDDGAPEGSALLRGLWRRLTARSR